MTATWDARSGPDDPLRPFTSTAQVPAVAGAYAGAGGGEPAIVDRRRPAPLGLRLAVWATALLVVAGLAVIGVRQAYPSWLSAAPARHSALAASGAATTTPGHSASSGSGPATPPAPTGPVSLTPSGPAAATVSVDSARYSVQVVAGGRCWVEVTTAGSTSPLFASVMAPGAQQTFQAANGKLGVELGASMVTVKVLLPNQRSPAWQWTPTAAPYQLSFTSRAG